MSEYMIEYFDDTIESIIERVGDQVHHRKNLILPSEIPFAPPTLVKINEEILSLFSSWSGILISCEFLQEREELSWKFVDTLELSSLSLEWSEKLGLGELHIEDLEGLCTILSSYSSPLIITKYAKRLQEFVDENGLTHVKIQESRHIYESFLLCENTALLGEKWKNPPIPPCQGGCPKGGGIDSFLLIWDDSIGKVFIQNRIRKWSIKNLDLLLSIKPLDHIVHRDHGIGKYIQILKKRIGLIEREYMEIEYALSDKVFVPLTELNRVTKYVGEENPPLMKLEGKEWERALSKTEEEIAIIANELLATDAKRKLEKWIRFKSFPKEEKAFEKAFSHIHTADQTSIIKEIRNDMEDETPMDRLISGDVGFWKTEVAMNAIYKAVLSGMQVACISPLLILAEEHRETFEERLWAFGVRIASLTRMTSSREEKEILEGIREGTIDLVVGTHRLLSEDVRFRRLGLLVIDEEHRFWVSQKETIKKMKSHIDILSLSATPIPRSLNMALSGMKKISILSTPPHAKKPIDTLITRWDESIIKKAIEKEIARGGQVIILHNRIRSLPIVEKEIEEILKDSRTSSPLNKGGQGGLVSDREGQGGFIPHFDADECKEKWLIYTGSHLPYNPNLIERAKEMRKNMTASEKIMWKKILSSFIDEKFLRQKPIDHYIVDFYSSKYSLVIEVDWDSHFESIEARIYDQERENILKEKYSLNILRFTNIEVKENTEWVYERIALEIERIKTQERSPQPPLSRGAPKIITIHGQLPPEMIEDRIHAFKKGEYDILISTTVIENGVNFLGANTIIISDAEEFWLAQLHQIRWRIGRKDVAGVCYLMYRKHELSSDERERMMVLAEHSSLGSGFEIAMRDMQIRGTGDILGFRQSGKTKEVGISLYFQLLEEKVEELKNGKKKAIGCKIELELSYVIDEEFFDSEMDKVSFFRDIDSIETLEDLDYAEATFGSWEMPENMQNLFLSLRISIILSGYSVKKIAKIGASYHFDFQEGARPDDLRRFLERFDPKGNMIIVSISKIRIETSLWKSPREFLSSLV